MISTALILLALLCLLDRQLARACLAFIAFALVMAFAWWRLGAPWLAVAEAVLGALLTGAALFHALGRAGDVPRLPQRDTTPRSGVQAAARWLAVLAWLLLAGLALVGLLASERLSLREAAMPTLVPAGLGVMALGLWAFAHHRHLLRRLLAFNVLGSGVFLLLAGLAGTAPEVQGLILVGLAVALVGSVLGALLLRRLHALEGSVTLEPEAAHE
ncbi:hydrogenase subunit MbhD domain-containing protein [Halomonas sp. JS92-SW72]|uniref:hydrogenase subunit MbhD domain-containing protein n=1 Tax=Halomonas sp. JS92-SW72 TaxID=2306583 RepID=UPI0019696636|nr:hydrogenase subunit MbhD domain-containing protein [Halomonas sp. JS92-SW72]